MQQAVGPRRVHEGVRVSTVFSYAGQSTHSTPNELDNIRYVSYRAAYTVDGMELMWLGRRYIAGFATFLALHGLLLALIRRILFHFGFGLYEMEMNIVLLSLHARPGLSQSPLLVASSSRVRHHAKQPLRE
ncbi:hypothetical protein LX32DRAFT_124724 [Colletotrichum zoysiae]|uniref:Uncharacterized protein n=1 Tax=Colletotrichum zoysiae TaxID=1216348 RepID=A0AAD9H9J5_9PEZI|nr:hypothetical protein LX32DRAFT_124724 [Colletotrichum zoysiae]